jgi:hypothetical protein
MQDFHFSTNTCFRNYLTAFALLFLLGGRAFADRKVPSSGAWSCYLYATSTNDTAGGTIFDDYWDNYNYPLHNSDWNCGSRFLLTDYTNQTINLQFAYGSEYSSPPVISHDIYIYNFSTNTLLTPTAITILDIDPLSGQPTVYTLPSTYTAAGGELWISYYRHGATPGIDSPDIRGYVTLVPQIQKMWIVATPICSGFSGTQYNFELHSNPELASVMQPAHYYNSGYPSCGLDDANLNKLTIDFSGSTIPVQQNWSNHGLPYGGTSDVVDGYSWLTYPSSSDHDLMHYFIYYSDLYPYLSLGAYYGQTPVIKVTVSDNYNSWTAIAPIIIEESVSDVVTHPGTPGAILTGTGTPTYFGPITNPAISYPTGTPNPSFNFYDYTITGTDA